MKNVSYGDFMEIKHIITAAGGAVALSKALGHRTHSSVLKWKHVPAQHILRIEEVTGIPREQLRPDLYIPRPIISGPDQKGAA